MEFSKKTVLITGAASGIGLLCAKCFAKEGAKVVLVDCNEPALKEAERDIRNETEDVLACLADIRDYDQVVRCRDEAVERFGTIDILVTCAGGAEARLMQAQGDFIHLPIEVVDFGIDVNLKGALYFDHAVMQQMAKQGSGVIIQLGSITGEEGCDTNVAYSASKSALMNGVVKSLARCGAKYGVRVCTVSPGPVLTRSGMAAMKTLLGRAARTQEIVDMIMYLASDKAAFVTGTNFLIDGGRNVLLNRGWD